MDEKQNIQLSVLDTESKYKVDYAEYTYGSNTDQNKPVGWGDDNKLPNLYYNCYTKSSTLKAIIDSCVNYVLGDDIVVKDDTAIWREKVNRNGMTMRQLIERISLSLLIYNGYACQIVYNKLGVPVEIFPLDFKRCRVSENGKKVFYAKNWTKYQGKYEEFDAYDPEHINMENPTQIFWYKSATLSNIYPLPMYNGAVYDILCEIESSRYSLNTVTNGFAAKHLIQFPENANLTDEQKQGIQDAIKNKFTGPDATASFLLYWKNGEDGQGLEVTKIESDDNAERFLAIRNSVRENIFISMRTTPALCGLPNATNGFSTSEYSDSLKIFLHNVISPIQDIILEGIDKMTGIKDGVEIVPYAINFQE